LANIFYHERLDKIQYLGILVIFVGVAIVTYF
jgi:drug/metabolite transporter (DMT)-like permease